MGMGRDELTDAHLTIDQVAVERNTRFSSSLYENHQIIYM